MSAIVSKADEGSESFRRYSEHNRGLAEELKAKAAKAALGGPEKHRERHVGRGKLLPRERVTRLLDPGSPFLEVGQLAANGMYGDEAPGAGMIAGIGASRGARR
jgi:3-methylcrotonyl-CoA carboxylase beta subunit